MNTTQLLIRVLGLFVLVAPLGCARPKYEVAAASPNTGAGLPIEKITDCTQKFSRSGYCVVWSWEKMPTSKDMGSFQFKVLRANLLDDSALPVALDSAPEVVLWMPSMGHGSTPVKVESVDQGSFRANNVFFVMPGEWEIKFQIKNGSEVVDEALVRLTI